MNDAEQELVILIGLPAAGKTTFHERRYASTHQLVSRDRMPERGDKGRRQLQLIEEALRSGASVVVDNTNPRRADRRPLIEIGHRLGAHVVGYFFRRDPAACAARNEQREGKARVPKAAIFITLKRLELPARDEGFDELFHVSAQPDFGFDVQPWES